MLEFKIAITKFALIIVLCVFSYISLDYMNFLDEWEIEPTRVDKMIDLVAKVIVAVCALLLITL